MKCCTSVVFAVLLTLVRGQAYDVVQACMKAFHPESIRSFCCGTMNSTADMNIFKTDPCGFMTAKQWTCQMSECQLGRLGILKNGKVDYYLINVMLEATGQRSPDVKPMTDAVRNTCDKGKYEHLLPGMPCESLKYQACFYLTAVTICPSWKQDRTCQEIVANLMKCKTLFNK
ncbi:uncharacterized protein LOC126381979 isoform X3 [Pectinophora gossypiella]|nr:uncharacterized protein LOC126381979 isoform X3 [Pectinophora gossypiella]XP_049887615.1 uncharacterized protein LOC126381979 isoform X3 [Pectinophora gossypiella]XP_049887625.1 uncharacterized protein LOC126381979 isoform X3 [Pectinophora gossypiella]